MVLTGEHEIQIQLLPPYFYLNLPSSTPQIWIRLRSLDLVYCNEVINTQ